MQESLRANRAQAVKTKSRVSSRSSTEMTDRESRILDFCQHAAVRVGSSLSQMYSGPKLKEQTEETLLREKQLIPAKTALGKIIRAIKSRDYTQLGSDDITEVGHIAPVVPEMLRFHSDLKGLRRQHRLTA